jgi:hypothetical protein
MATGAVMAVKMKARTVPVVMAASCARSGCPARLSSNIGRAVTDRQAVAPSRGRYGGGWQSARSRFGVQASALRHFLRMACDPLVYRQAGGGVVVERNGARKLGCLYSRA